MQSNAFIQPFNQPDTHSHRDDVLGFDEVHDLAVVVASDQCSIDFHDSIAAAQTGFVSRSVFRHGLHEDRIVVAHRQSVS